jgi:hypothetical protein
MNYQVWDSVSIGYLEPLTPFTKLFESDKLQDVIDFVDNKSKNVVLFVTLKNGTILFDTTIPIYESPDGKTIYKRTPLSNKSNKLNKL